MYNGYPTQVLMDDRGEFVNSELIELAEEFNIVLKTTAAESAWSNVMCEKHNGFMGDMVIKIQMDSDCLLQMLTSDQIKKFKQVVGQINLMATQAYPDMAYDSCVMGNSASESTVADLHGIKQGRQEGLWSTSFIVFSNDFHLSFCQLIGYSDATFTNLQDQGSQSGFIMFIMDAQGEYAPVLWQSKHVKRVVNSTLLAECLEAVDASETGILLGFRLEEMLCLLTAYRFHFWLTANLS